MEMNSIGLAVLEITAEIQFPELCAGAGAGITEQVW